VGQVCETGNDWEPWELLDPRGQPIDAVAVYFRDLQAAGRSAATLRGYGLDLLRWFRFLWAIDVPWDRATRVEARDFCLWLGSVRKPALRNRRVAAGAVNAVTGKTSPGAKYAPATRARNETVLRRFYDLHMDTGLGPIINPFPLDQRRSPGRANAHNNPMMQFHNVRTGLYRPRVPQRAPRNIPDDWLNQLFAALSSHRDRAMVAFWVSSGVRASELICVRQGDVDPGQQLITVVRKGTRAIQQVPASPDAFVWLRLYQSELGRSVPRGHRQPLWWTARQPYHPLTYHAAYRMFERVNASIGANWSLHDLRHTAAHRMARDPQMPLSDVQWVLGHALLSTTQRYLTPTRDEVIETVRAYHARRAAASTQQALPAPGYRAESLTTLFGRQTP
jgi:integrase